LLQIDAFCRKPLRAPRTANASLRLVPERCAGSSPFATIARSPRVSSDREQLPEYNTVILAASLLASILQAPAAEGLPPGKVARQGGTLPARGTQPVHELVCPCDPARSSQQCGGDCTVIPRSRITAAREAKTGVEMTLKGVPVLLAVEPPIRQTVLDWLQWSCSAIRAGGRYRSWRRASAPRRPARSR